MPDHTVIFNALETTLGEPHATGFLPLWLLAVLLTSCALTPGHARDVRADPSHWSATQDVHLGWSGAPSHRGQRNGHCL